MDLPHDCSTDPWASRTGTSARLGTPVHAQEWKLLGRGPPPRGVTGVSVRPESLGGSPIQLAITPQRATERIPCAAVPPHRCILSVVLASLMDKLPRKPKSGVPRSFVHQLLFFLCGDTYTSDSPSTQARTSLGFIHERLNCAMSTDYRLQSRNQHHGDFKT
jgi:hypothetical protein